MLKRFTFHVMWMSWIASRAMNTFWGVSMTVRGTGGLTADMLLLAVYQFDGMIWSALRLLLTEPSLRHGLLWLRPVLLFSSLFTPVCFLCRGVNQIVDLFPSLARTMQPLTRVASLLDSVPKIVSAAAPFPA